VGKGEVVLVVDDEETVLRATEAVLRHHGYEVLLAFRRRSGGRHFRRDSGRIGVVLTRCDDAENGRHRLDPRAAKNAGEPADHRGHGTREEARRTELHALGVAKILDKPFGAT